MSAINMIDKILERFRPSDHPTSGRMVTLVELRALRRAIVDPVPLMFHNDALQAELDAERHRADQLAGHLGAMCDQLYDKRYTTDGPCPGCYDAVEAHKAARGPR